MAERNSTHKNNKKITERKSTPQYSVKTAERTIRKVHDGEMTKTNRSRTMRQKEVIYMLSLHIFGRQIKPRWTVYD